MAFSAVAAAVLLVLCVASHARPWPCAEQEKATLLRFLAGLTRDGGLAASWRRNGTAAECCSWEGITCNTNGTVVEVLLSGRGLEGRISPALGDLTGLQRLNLSRNSLSGGLPLRQLVSSGTMAVVDVSFNRLNGELGELLPSSVNHGWSLQVLNISSNMFTGEFPSSTWKLMNNLVALNASNNSFSGQIPCSFCHLASASFAVLDLQHNKFSGNIPPALGNCSKLSVLMLGRNSLAGTIPDEIFNAISLERLSFRNSGLRGTLDGARVAKLIHLVTLDLGENGFTGKIPDSIGQLKRLEELYLDYNSMSGEIPSSLCNCTSLRSINLRNNNLGGELSKVNFSTLQNLESLDVAMNNFNGTVPESIYSCTKMTALRVSENSFHGELSPKIGNLKSLTFLSLFRNSFTNITNSLQILKNSKNLRILFLGKNFMREAMPQDSSIDGFDNLQILGINRCSLTGKLPIWLSKLRSLEVLLLNNNRLDGPMPGWINHLNRLIVLDVANNSFTGEIPTALLEMEMLKSVKIAPPDWDTSFFALPIYLTDSREYRLTGALPKALDLSNNNFTGVIPQDIGHLLALNSLNLSFNRFYGQIPQALCNLTNLQILDLSSNLLNGTIPASLNNLYFLSKFNVSNNDLEGPVPTRGQLSTFPESSFDGNPKLCGSVNSHPCNALEEAPDSVTVTTAIDSSDKVIFVTSFVVSFGLGVLYEQLVLYKFPNCIQL